MKVTVLLLSLFAAAQATMSTYGGYGIGMAPVNYGLGGGGGYGYPASRFEGHRPTSSGYNEVPLVAPPTNMPYTASYGGGGGGVLPISSGGAVAPVNVGASMMPVGMTGGMPQMGMSTGIAPMGMNTGMASIPMGTGVAPVGVGTIPFQMGMSGMAPIGVSNTVAAPVAPVAPVAPMAPFNIANGGMTSYVGGGTSGTMMPIGATNNIMPYAQNGGGAILYGGGDSTPYDQDEELYTKRRKRRRSRRFRLFRKKRCKKCKKCPKCNCKKLKRDSMRGMDDPFRGDSQNGGYGGGDPYGGGGAAYNRNNGYGTGQSQYY